jgi:L-amino acid N-acyltransferase YncA
MLLRDATEADLPAINVIYNHCVLTSTCTYQVTPSTLEERQAWFTGRGPRHPAIVVEENGEVIAWGSLQPFNKREAYAGTVENSVYVHHDHYRRGLGTLVMEELFRRAREAGVHSIIALISADQEGSIGLHRALGFVEAGRLREVGCKFGQVLDVVYLQYMIE